MDVLILFGGLIAMMLVGLPITFAMGSAAVFYLLVTGQTGMLIMLPNRMVLACESYGLMAIPFFFFAGAIMSSGGLTLRLVNFSRVMVGHVTGSLALINVIASMFFSGISGSCVSDTSAIGSVLIPAMKKDGYSPEFSAAVTGSSSTIGHIIPPSIPMILIGVMQEMPIGKLFLAGAIPGLMLGFALLGLSYVISVKRNYPKEEKRSDLRTVVRAVADGFLVLIMPVIVVCGIVFGVVTVTETGVLACIYGIILGFFYREITLKTFWTTIKDAAKSVGNLLLILATAGFFGWVLINTGVANQLVDLILSISTNKYLVLTMLVIALLIIGCGLDVIAIVFIFIPVMIPLVERVGLDPYHFSAVFVLCMGIALLTPPVGIILYMISDMSEAPLLKVMKEIVPFILIEIAVLAVVMYIPSISTWLPGLISK